MEHLEDSIPFEARRVHAKAYGLSGSGFQDWLVSLLQEIRGLPTAFDYATRVALCQRLLDHLNRDYKKACKLALEKILFNLAPNPDQVVLAVHGHQSGANRRELSPLNDDVTRGGEGLLEARYALLTRALQLYCEIGLE
ncbi:MAG: hypothetical protein ACYTGH_18270, partial [Planctomycetota bacterium]